METISVLMGAFIFKVEMCTHTNCFFFSLGRGGDEDEYTDTHTITFIPVLRGLSRIMLNESTVLTGLEQMPRVI
jgi:hypothetical protein